jgi:hypothetical protein
MDSARKAHGYRRPGFVIQKVAMEASSAALVRLTSQCCCERVNLDVMSVMLGQVLPSSKEQRHHPFLILI